MEVRVRSGDSLWYYSRLFKMPLNLIIDANPYLEAENLKMTDKIRIPGYLLISYTIKNGDTLAIIASSNSLPLDAILLVNQTRNPDQFIADEIILIPVRVTLPFLNTKIPCDYNRLIVTMNSLEKVYPFINVTKIGESVLGNSIDEIRIGKGTKKIHMNASFHANEWITTMILMGLVNNFLLSLTNRFPLRGLNTMDLYKDVELSVVPMVNPDGVDLVLHGPPSNCHDEVVNINNGSDDFVHWKANIRGIDLNNQYPAKWEIEKIRKVPKSPAPRDYPGSSPLTEPEAIAMAEWTKKHSFDCILAFHTQGEEFYWGYEGFEPAESEAMAKEFERVSGYQAIQYVDSHAGYKDWYIQEFKRAGFTIELGKGINPLPLSMYNEIYKKAEGIFLAALYL